MNALQPLRRNDWHGHTVRGNLFVVRYSWNLTIGKLPSSEELLQDNVRLISELQRETQAAAIFVLVDPAPQEEYAPLLRRHP